MLRPVDEWAPPGYRVEQMLGFGTLGEVWRAREQTTGERVALQRLHAATTPELLAHLRAGAGALEALRTPYVVRVRAVDGAGPRPVVVLDHAAGGSLAALLRRRSRFAPGEVVTLAVPLAEALAQAHAAGLVHGGLTPSCVLLTADGMPLLGDLGTTAGGEPEQDVRDLARLCVRLLEPPPPRGLLVDAPAEEPAAPGGLAVPPDVPRALAPVLEEALAGRCTAAELAMGLRAAHPAVPVRGTGADPGTAGEPPRRARPGETAPEVDRPRRAAAGDRTGAARAPGSRRGAHRSVRVRWPLVAAGGALLVLAALWSRGPEPVADAVGSQAPAATAAAVAVDWAAVLQGLDEARAQAYAHADPDLLAQVYAPGTVAARADAAALTALRDRGRAASGVRHELLRVEPRSAGADRVELDVVDVLGPQQVHDRQNAVVEQRAGRGERAYVVELVRSAEGWRLADVRPRGG